MALPSLMGSYFPFEGRLSANQCNVVLSNYVCCAMSHLHADETSLLNTNGGYDQKVSVRKSLKY